MRMWGVDPRLLCRQHLLGEHKEMHMFKGTLEAGISIRGYVDKGLVEVHKIIMRHDTLATEMTKRGMNHKSPLPEELSDYLWEEGSVDVNANLQELARRCPSCRERQTLHPERVRPPAPGVVVASYDDGAVVA